jgi:glyoxalase family protein
MPVQDFIKGIHHVTATVNDAQEDYDFYTKLLGLRLVKKTVNFDNNQVYHFYYGNELGEPGTIMTTFPYKGHGVRQGTIGTGQVAVTAFSVPMSAVPFWENRLKAYQIAVESATYFGSPSLKFEDPSGLLLQIVGSDNDDREPWTTPEISASEAIRGFYSVILSIAEPQPTVDFLTNVFGFEKVAEQGNITRFAAQGGGPGKYADILHDQSRPRGINGLGTVHHVAWKIENDPNQLELRKHLVEELGFNVTEVKDRKYFHSIYFRIPGGVLFEVATIPPGFAIDESPENLGLELKLPDWEESVRGEIESGLPKVDF